ncbi:MAG: hypothetical protein CMJ78_00250 [Planctomycetaceae bacterium]|nr:hypothetical protein [Planctomycetaceae bacterium]
MRIVGFAERNDGELLLLDYDDGSIHELIKNPDVGSVVEFPTKLSDTGLFESVSEHTPARGVVPFSINAAQWSDHAHADRWIGLPGDAAVGIQAKKERVSGSMFSRVMDYPKNAVLMKTLSLELTEGDPTTSRRVETQLLHFNGYDWRGYSYRWNEAQTDAELVGATGSSQTFDIADSSALGGRRRQTWRFPSRTECIRCHNPWAEFSLAFNPAQLNHHVGGQNQLERLYAMGVVRDAQPELDPNDKFAVALKPMPIDERPRLVNPFDESVALESRARSYLHVNCAHCHRFNGGGSARIYLPFDMSIYKTEALDTRPSQGTFGIENARIIAPGQPYDSVLYFRMAKSGSGHMPHLGSRIVHNSGLKLVHDWIQQLPQNTDIGKLIEQLAGLDEETVLANEQREEPVTKWKVAARLASAANREYANQADIDKAAVQVASDAKRRAASRSRQRPKLITELLSNSEGAVTLNRALRDGRFPQSINDQIVKLATRHDNIAVRDLFESFVPADQRIARLGDSIDSQALLKVKGDAKRGFDLYLNAQGVSCRNCHKVRNQGRAVGPNLDGIGKKRTRVQLLDSLLTPSKEIEPKFAAWVVRTESGKAFTGLLVERSDERVVLRDPQNKEHQIAAEEIDEMFRQRKSLMPDRLLRDLTAQQAADLLAWLESLK